MRTYQKLLLFFVAITFSSLVYGQSKDDAKTIVDQGVALHDEGKYDEAMDKYNTAIKLDPKYSNAYYELAYTLFSTQRGKEAIPYLEKVLKLSPNGGGAYDMLGSIYDDDKQTDKAIDFYLKGIKVDPAYQRLHFNLAITYYRMGKNAEAEASAIEAIKLDPKHASSQRIYALATYDQDKRGISLLAWCSFLLLEPQTKRSEEAYKYLQKILNYGIKKTSEKKITLNVNTRDIDGPNFLLPMAVLTATSDKKDLSRTDSLALQLASVFKISDIFAGKQGNPFYKRFFSDYFKAMGQTDNMPAFAHFVSLSAYKDEVLQWFKDNDKQLIALDSWVKNTPREP